MSPGHRDLQPPAADPASRSVAGSRPAVRSGRPGWRDPRLWVGVGIVAASVLVGARLLASADDTVTVWAAAHDLASGSEVTEADLTTRRVRFADDDLTGYLDATDDLPTERWLTHDVPAGDLLPASALAAPAVTGLLAVPVAVPALAVPPSVERGARVDVWVATEGADGTPVARPVLTDVTVLDAPPPADGFGLTTDRQLVLAVDQTQSRRLGRVLAAVGSGGLTVVGRG